MMVKDDVTQGQRSKCHINCWLVTKHVLSLWRGQSTGFLVLCYLEANKGWSLKCVMQGA